MRVLVTGAAGFIGSNLTKKLLDDEFEVCAVDDLSNGHVEFLPKELLLGATRTNSYFVNADFTDKIILDAIARNEFDAVIHLAAVPRVSYSVEHPLETNDVNVSRTLLLIDAVRKSKTKRFVFASSSSVYGGADAKHNPTNENSPKDPKSPYALQKSIIEDYLSLYNTLYNLDSICLRFFNVFGPNQLGDSPYATAVSAWLSAIKKGKPMRSDGTGEQSRDMCYVDNVVDACIRAATSTKTFAGNRYNVSCGDSTTNNAILEYIMKRYPNAVKVDAPWRPGDVMHTWGDISAIERDLGYKPLVKIWEGIDRTIDWVESSDHFLTLTLRT